MTEAYDGNGDYSSYNDDESDYKRKGGGGNAGGGGPHPSHNGDNSNHDHHPGDGPQLNDKANEYIRDCLTEKNRMDKKYPIAEKLLESEIEKVQSTGRIPSRDQKYADIYREKPLRVSQKVLVPIREHPKFNFVGKLLGPKGNSLRRLQEETLCKMTVLGRNSMRDRAKEEELRASMDPKYAHLNSDLHVEISTIAPPAEAYARIAYAMAELRKYLIPDSNDVIRQEQLRELMDNTGISDHDPKSYNKKASAVSGGGGGGSGGGIGVGGGATGSSSGGGGSHMTSKPNVSHHGYRWSAQPQNNHLLPMYGAAAVPANNFNFSSSLPASSRQQPPQQQQQQQQQQQPQPSFAKNSIPPKQKVMSILEKARSAMDESYSRGYDEQTAYEPQTYDSYSYGHAQTHGPPHGQTSRTPYDTQEYEQDYNRRDYYQHSPNYGGPGATSQHSGNTNPTGGLNPNHNRSHVNR
ncbi:KH domain-containing, RNA-binding, signal transduction-associated protein 2 isoform X1 [Episyrphus balteatus]|uniref:KH domain-containing, RNA-binding, signal transduction-associated protein 2 isoform X1 n=1 Tax=Episyrphus balteatus TaxID=286459 RepID=UPI0024854C7D|nr:KH domain-containing, RNA-binding, signal transduction-associated protein 2 isoform X1 [Episyrphus balteatus]XP_055857149.1 KH domain-containing, RNA-binding, signal transduction-associated protein 2 isoform X1 [Episyrphus balteatus]